MSLAKKVEQQMKRLLLTYLFVAEELYEDHQVLIPAQVFFGL